MSSRILHLYTLELIVYIEKPRDDERDFDMPQLWQTTRPMQKCVLNFV
jgi:hypothetical protein